MPPDLYAYLGVQEKTYPAYLEVPADGPARTLIGTPGMDPVAIRKAAGADLGPDVGADGEPAPRPPLPDVPGDGSWVLVDPPANPPAKAAASADEPQSTAKSRKAVA